MVVTGTNGLTVADSDGSNGKLILEDVQKQASGTTWSPDGEWIAFGYGAFFEGPNPTPTRLMLIHPDGTGLRALTSPDENSGSPTWSPDGKLIAYRYAKGARRGLAILNVATGETRSLDTGSELATFPTWSPRGDWISFTSLRDGNYDVYVDSPRRYGPQAFDRRTRQRCALELFTGRRVDRVRDGARRFQGRIDSDAAQLPAVRGDRGDSSRRLRSARADGQRRRGRRAGVGTSTALAHCRRVRCVTAESPSKRSVSFGR